MTKTLPAQLPVAARPYADEARRIIALVKERFTFPDGTLFLERTGEKVFPHHIFPDLGDVLPFFLYFGETEFMDLQVKRYEAQLRNGMLVSEFPTLGFRHLVKSYEYTDLILGLAAYAEAAHTPERKRVLDQVVQSACTAFNLPARPRSFYHAPTGIRLPIIDTRDATLIECFTTLYRATKDERMLVIARALYEELIKTPFFRAYSLFADYEPTNALAKLALRNKPKTRTATLCKNTTNALFAFLDLYRITRDEKVLEQTMRMARAVAERALSPSGGVIERYIPGTKPGPAYLTASFPYLDFLCDLAQESPQHRAWALEVAHTVADAWLLQQGKTGLFSLREGQKETFLDSETDMVVALTKLAEVTGEARYRDAAGRCLEGILAFHGHQDYPLGVDIETGEVRTITQRTKFLCLFLKVLILKIEQQAGGSIYGDPELFELLKDR